MRVFLTYLPVTCTCACTCTCTCVPAPVGTNELRKSSPLTARGGVGGTYGSTTKKLGLFGAELLKCARAQILTKSAKVGDGRPARSRVEGARRSLHKKVLAPQAGAKPLTKASKAGARGWAGLHKKVLAPAAGPKLLKWPLPAASQKGHGSAGGAKLLKRAPAPRGAEQNC